MLNFDAFELIKCASRKNTPTTWFGSMSGEVTELGHDSVFVSSGQRDFGTTFLLEHQTRSFIKYLLAKAASCKDSRNLVNDIGVAFMHARTDEENLCESAFRHQKFQILETQGSSEWNQKSFKALAGVLM